MRRTVRVKRREKSTELGGASAWLMKVTAETNGTGARTAELGVGESP